jgi:hypothetical protein
VEEKARWLIEEKWLLVGIRVEEDWCKNVEATATLLADLSDVEMALTEDREVGRRREVTVNDLNTMDGQSMVSSESEGLKEGRK